mmetsp:Transcript_77811/g.161656  ORF Transcript_77811/g.161656 Transcript_77811/m.161656 type:complete len:95 (-) Transcript_77811:1627-1911(-)
MGCGDLARVLTAISLLGCVDLLVLFTRSCPEEAIIGDIISQIPDSVGPLPTRLWSGREEGEKQLQGSPRPTFQVFGSMQQLRKQLLPFRPPQRP